MADALELSGTWELTYITGPRITFDGLFPHKRPRIKFDTTNRLVSGNTSCNNFSGKLNVEGNEISFSEPMAMTQIMCMGDGECVFLELLKKVNKWSVINGKTLNFKMRDTPVMLFKKKAS